jgi:hypothetical protein
MNTTLIDLLQTLQNGNDVLRPLADALEEDERPNDAALIRSLITHPTTMHPPLKVAFLLLTTRCYGRASNPNDPCPHCQGRGWLLEPYSRTHDLSKKYLVELKKLQILHTKGSIRFNVAPDRFQLEHHVPPE